MRTKLKPDVEGSLEHMFHGMVHSLYKKIATDLLLEFSTDGTNLAKGSQVSPVPWVPGDGA